MATMYSAEVEYGQQIRLRIRDATTGEEEAFSLGERAYVPDRIFGVYGMVGFNSSRVLILITQAVDCGSIRGHSVFEATGAVVLPVSACVDRLFVRRVRQFFELPGIFFSRYELHNRHYEQGRGASEFLFNEYPLSLYRAEHAHFALHCIQGLFRSYRGLCLVSRRSTRRLGARFFSRGADRQGNCSNYVETEQILDGESSYLQIRASIPFRWSHLLTWRYSPVILLRSGGAESVSTTTLDGRSTNNTDNINNTDSMDVMNNTNETDIFHAADKLISDKYPESIIYFNLIRNDGYEQKLSKIFRAYLSAHRSAYSFDFHRSASPEQNLPFDPRITGFATPRSGQAQIIRTNCIDCLDRTNSAQYLIGKAILRLQLLQAPAGDRPPDEPTDESSDRAADQEYQGAFARMFCENGDYLSTQYAGTPALLSAHILPAGWPVLRRAVDGCYSVRRYFINRLRHGRLQDSYDILTGKLRTGSLTDRRAKTYRAATLLTVLYILMWARRHATPASWMCSILLVIFILSRTSRLLVNTPVARDA